MDINTLREAIESGPYIGQVLRIEKGLPDIINVADLADIPEDDAGQYIYPWWTDNNIALDVVSAENADKIDGMLQFLQGMGAPIFNYSLVGVKGELTLTENIEPTMRHWFLRAHAVTKALDTESAYGTIPCNVIGAYLSNYDANVATVNSPFSHLRTLSGLYTSRLVFILTDDGTLSQDASMGTVELGLSTYTALPLSDNHFEMLIAIGDRYHAIRTGTHQYG